MSLERVEEMMEEPQRAGRAGVGGVGGSSLSLEKKQIQEEATGPAAAFDLAYFASPRKR